MLFDEQVVLCTLKHFFSDHLNTVKLNRDSLINEICKFHLYIRTIQLQF